MGLLSGIISLGTSVAGSFLGAKGQVDAGKASKANAIFQARVLRNNAKLADTAAQQTIERGEVERSLIGAETRKTVGRQKVALAANGVLVDRDSALDLTVETQVVGDFNTRILTQNYKREALNFTIRAANLREEAGLVEETGASAASAGRVAAFGTALEGAGTVAASWNTWFSK